MIEAHERLVSALAEVGSFALNLIDEDSSRTGPPLRPESETSLDGMTVVRGASGHPLLGDSVAQLECAVHESGSIGELRAYLADITDACARAGASLDSIGGDLRNFVASRDDATYQEIRNAIMDRRFPVDREVVVAELIEQLGVERANVIYGLTRLIHEGLVTRRDAERYIADPRRRGPYRHLATRSSHPDDRHHQNPHHRADRRRDRHRSSKPPRRRRRPPGTIDIGMENDRSVRVFQDFNELVVGLSGNSVLLDTYRRLSVPTVMGRVLWRLDWSTLHDELSEHALAFARGIAARDRDRAILAVNPSTILFRTTVSASFATLADASKGRRGSMAHAYASGVVKRSSG